MKLEYYFLTRFLDIIISDTLIIYGTTACNEFSYEISKFKKIIQKFFERGRTTTKREKQIDHSEFSECSRIRALGDRES
jgi:hypothetical protein